MPLNKWGNDNNGNMYLQESQAWKVYPQVFITLIFPDYSFVFSCKGNKSGGVHHGTSLTLRVP